MRITLVTSSLSCGGAERVLTMLANEWARSGREVGIVTIDSREHDFYPLAPGIRRVGLDLAAPSRHALAALASSLRRIRALRRSIRALDPDVVISFMEKPNILTLLACRRIGAPAIVSERVDPGRYSAGRTWDLLRRWLYPGAAAVVVQTERLRQWFRRCVPRADVHVIPNPVEPPDSSSRPSLPPEGDGPLIAGMGRLTRQKGFDILIQAFARCSPGHAGWSLVILGEGEERGSLSDLCARLGVAGRVRLPGCLPDPGGILRRARLFVLPSRFEGFPNALLEAMACGIPAIAADCPSGPREILEEGESGVLVPPEDVGALAAAMDRLMSDAGERRRLGARAAEVVRRFALPGVLARWDDLIERVTRERGRRGAAREAARREEGKPA